jgi:hypothetical protein
MAKGNSGIIHSNAFNEVNSTDPNVPDVTGDGIYFNGWDEIMKMHLSETGDLVSTPNSDASHGIFGGPAQGEANPAGMGGMGGKK